MDKCEYSKPRVSVIKFKLAQDDVVCTSEGRTPTTTQKANLNNDDVYDITP